MHAPNIAPSVMEAVTDPGSSPSPRVPAVTSLPKGRRSRLSRDLHDGVGQSIISVLVELRVAIDRGYAARDELMIIEREAQEALSAVRAVAYQVRQRSRIADPLAEARRYAEHLIGASGATLRWVDERVARRLSLDVANELASSIRESINNAIDHGLAHAVEVCLSPSDSGIRVTVRDDGVGFDAEDLDPTPDGRGLGLLGIAERMAEIGGIFSVRSSPGAGAVVVLEAPRFVRKGSAIRPANPAVVRLSVDRHPQAAMAGVSA